MKSLIYSFSVFVLLLLINITYNLNINNALDNSISEIQDDTNLKVKRHMIRNLNETQVAICNKTYEDKVGSLSNVTGIYLTGSQFNGGGANSTDYTYVNKTGSGNMDSNLRFTSYVNNSDPICTLYTWNS